MSAKALKINWKHIFAKPITERPLHCVSQRNEDELKKMKINGKFCAFKASRLSDDDKFSGNKNIMFFSSKILAGREFDERFIFVKRSIKEILRVWLSLKEYKEILKARYAFGPTAELFNVVGVLHDENERLFEW